ncbi:hypothetical protein BD410DRAFT_382747 [Rickenella mellea]|uniref:F-box domain-containing protein n=1 Tax=Rickenella mellea TaxID=50990 RepID=A0A4Y7PYC8_9AGAM|nr:hypothetical protein BD410DRAFT_382747 [Rickenella mellea]
MVVPTIGRFPFLHTIEASQRNLFDHFDIVRLPSLSTFHVRNENVPDLVEGMMMFSHQYGKTIKTLTMIGTVGKRAAKCFAIFLPRCTKLEELVMDVLDLIRLLALHQVLHRKVTMLSLTNDASTRARPSGSNLLATSIPNLRVHFPELGVLRWLGEVDRSASCSHTQECLDSLEGDADASEVHTSEIRIENRDGEKLESDWLLVR